MKEESDYLLRVISHPEQNTEDKFYEKLTRFGTLTLNYNLAASLTPQQLYEAYKQRNEIEVIFDNYKILWMQIKLSCRTGMYWRGG